MPADPQPNLDLIRQRAASALTANTTFLNIASPSTAQVAAQMKALTRQVNAVLRVEILGDYSNVSDT